MKKSSSCAEHAVCRRVFGRKEIEMNLEKMNVTAVNYNEPKNRTLSEKIFMAVSLAACLSMFLPWFSFNPGITGYMWGFSFFPHWLVPIAFILVYQFLLDEKNVVCVILMELSLLAVPCVLLYDMATWHVMSITGEISLQTGLTTAQPTFWAAAGLSIASFLTYQATLLKKKF